MQSDTAASSGATVLFKKTAIIIAILGQKILERQLNKVIPSRMYNYNYETIN